MKAASGIYVGKLRRLLKCDENVEPAVDEDDVKLSKVVRGLHYHEMSDHLMQLIATKCKRKK